jgi:single-stranded DNA-binding protein
MSGGVNRDVLVGVIGKYGVEVKYANNGTPCASFTLAVVELGQDGREHTTLIPCECWGKKVEAAGVLEAGQLVLFEGKIRRRPMGGDLWETVVSGFEGTPITAAVSTSSN